jgi:hypothetical protein
MSSDNVYKYTIYVYKYAKLIGLENICPELALLIEKDTGITQDQYHKYELPTSNKPNEVMAVIYFFKLFDYFYSNNLNDKLEEYFELSKRVVDFASAKLGIPAYKLTLEAENYKED